MIVALAGKGGAGKTTISATLARTLSREGWPVVAIDADSNPNLGVALGLPAGTPANSLPAGLVSRKLHGPALTLPLDAVLDEYATPGPDGIALLVMGMPAHAEEGCLCSAHATVSAVLHELKETPRTATIVDLEASPEHLSRGTARHADVLLLIAEPYFRSLESVRRQAKLAAELPISRVVVVANKTRSASDRDAISEFCARHDLELIGAVPWSDQVIGADIDGVPLVDSADCANVVGAVAAVAAQIMPARQLPG